MVTPPLRKPDDQSRVDALVVSALPAVIVPALLAFNLPPSATFLNQAAALVGWGGFALVLAHQAGRGPWIAGQRGLGALLAALALLLASAVGSAAFTGLPLGLAASAVGVLLAAMLVVACAAAAAQQGRGAAAFHAFSVALVAAGVLSTAVAMVQVFAPGWADGHWIAPTALVGRASGNLRQPNHLSSLLLWSVIAALWLGESGRWPRAGAAGLAALFVFALVLSGSRTGLLGVVFLALWGALDRRLSGRTRLLLLLAPVWYAACWFGLTAWAHQGHAAIVDERRFTVVEGNLSASRFGIWGNTLTLIGRHPWLGVGWGEFNFAWSLTPFPDRSHHFFDHTHNLPLQFAVELGLPLAALVLALLAYALWRAFAAAGRNGVRDENGKDRALYLRAAFMMVLMITLHSQLEYPLWYAYFLLPTAFAFGLCLGADAPATAAAARAAPPSSWATRPLVIASMLLIGGGALSVVDYAHVVAIFQSGENAAPLAERIARGQRSAFFSHHAAYAAATTGPATAAGSADAFNGATHYLLDTRLMTAWANALAAAGDTERARHVSQRLREFRSADSVAYFEPCDDPDPDRPENEPLPYQCTPPTKAFDHRDFR